jgi:hypothetical protein
LENLYTLRLLKNIVTMNKLSLLIVFTIVFISSCTIQKRQHLPGYHIEWKGSEAKRSESVQKMPSDFSSIPSYTEEIKQEAIHGSTHVADSPKVEPKQAEVEVAKSGSAPASEISGKKKHTGMKLTFPLSFRSPVQLLTGKAMPDEGKKTDGISIAAMVCGILAFFVPTVGIVLAILAIVFGGIGMGRTRRNPELKGRGMAIAGLVLGILAFVVVLLLAAYLVAFFSL